jgi:hypothetical membrane protein
VSARDRACLPIAAALIGSTVIAVASIVAGVAYTGRAGEAYSPLDHWVSELGEVGVSSLAHVFNAGLVIGGVCFALFMLGLASSRTGRLRTAYGVIGAIAGVAGCLVGVFPMNQLGAHRLAALTFFDLGWIAVALASIDFVRRPDPRSPRWLAIMGGATVAAFLAFLGALSVDPLVAAGELDVPARRPAMWNVTTLEWAVIAGIVAWTFLTAAAWWRSLPRAARPAADAP